MTISVIIPAYNAANFIVQAIQSAQAQTHPPLEVFVIDDGSADETVQIVEQYLAGASQNAVPVYLLRQENGGPASARNHGARKAKGDWLAFLDADDTFLPQKLEKQRAYAGDERVGIIHSIVPAPSEPITFDTLWQKNHIVNSTVLVRRVAFEQVGGFDEERALIGVEDYNLWLRLVAANWQVATCAGEWIAYTPVPGSLTSQVERFAQAELFNCEKIARALNLPSIVVEQKRLRIYDEYGRVLLSSRHTSAARRLFASALRSRPTIKRLGWLTVSCAPPFLLNMRRRARTPVIKAAA